MNNNKKFGVSYNVFDDSIELLRDSILSIKSSVDYISVIYQTVSNVGNNAVIDIEPTLNSLIEEGLVNKIQKYNPIIEKGPHYNEVTKRNLGLNLSRKNGCTYHMAMDSDEFYLSEQLTYIKELYIKEDLDGGFCQMETYYKDFEHRLEPKEDYYVSLFYKIEGDLYSIQATTPVVVDPTRKITKNNVKVFTRDEIEMFHASYVRSDVRSKFINSSAKVNFENDIENLIYYFNNWQDGDDALVAGKPPKKYKLVKVENKFGIKPIEVKKKSSLELKDLISFNITYWESDDIDRLYNTKMCIHSITKLIKYLNNYGINSQLNIFDFSEEQIIENSIHIPYPKGEFKKSEKINNVIKYNNDIIKPKIFTSIDSDIFIMEQQYEELKTLILQLLDNDKMFYTCYVQDILNRGSIDLINNTINLYQTPIMKRPIPSLGAFYCIHFKELYNIGGFDERFLVWGGEDDDVKLRLERNGLIMKQIDTTLYHMPHRNLNFVVGGEQYNKQCYILDNDKSIIRISKILKNDEFNCNT